MSRKSDRRELLDKILAWRIEKQKTLGVGFPTTIQLTQAQHDLIGIGFSYIYGMRIRIRETTDNTETKT